MNDQDPSDAAQRAPEPEQPKRGPHRWKPGQSGNPKGRPRRGHALSEAVRAGADPAELVTIALDLARAADSEATRIAALTWLRDSGYQRPAERHEIAAVAADDDDLDLSALTVDQLRELADLERRRDAILAAADPVVSTGGIIDIAEEPRALAAPRSTAPLATDRDSAGLAR